MNPWIIFTRLFSTLFNFNLFFYFFTGIVKNKFLLVQAQSELGDYWVEDRYIRCIFCMDYDDRQRLNIYGCALSSPPTCFGNICYMRQHKSQHYYLYTSGCLNLTQSQFNLISERVSSKKPERGNSGTETQLCEVTPQLNACVCTNRHNCNNVSSGEPFTEHTFNFLLGIRFNEIAHFKYFAPNDPILEQLSEFRADQSFSINCASTKIVSLVVPISLISVFCSRFFS